MGGKTWSREEELFFWHTIVPISPKAAVQVGKPVDWDQCASMMQKHFGEAARRRYTKLMLFEHYFQNITTGHKSPHAADLVAEHKRYLGAHGKLDDDAPMEHQARARRTPKKQASGRVTKPARRCLHGARRPQPLDQADEAADESDESMFISDSTLQPEMKPAYPVASSHQVLREPYMPPIVQAPGPAGYHGGYHGGYHSGYYYHGLAAAQDGGFAWSHADDLGYSSVTTPSSHSGSPAAPDTIRGGSDTEAAARPEDSAERDDAFMEDSSGKVNVWSMGGEWPH